MVELFIKFKNALNKLIDLPPLLFRLILSYGFYEPAMRKMSNVNAIAEWFAGMNYPFPTLNAYMATITETSGFILLFLGLGTRIISIPLSVVMLVAIFTVHIDNGFHAGNNGFEIPLYYLSMLFSLIVIGPGKYSIDAFIKRRFSK